MYLYNLGLKYKALTAAGRDKPALWLNGETQLTFGALDDLSNRLAGYLLAQGLKPRQVVAIANDKTAFGFAAMLACLKLGLIYTNFDFSNPKERLAKIFETAAPSFILADKTLTPDIQDLSRRRRIPCGDYGETNFKETIANYPAVYPAETEAISGANPAYIMFTSGSTGVPKGVLIKQESLLNFIAWAKETYALTPDDILTNVNPIYFDNSVFDFYASIFNGLTMAAFSRDIVSQPKKLLELIERTGCTFWFSVPSLLIYLSNMKILTPEVFRTVKTFTFGGEGYPKEQLRKLYDLYSPAARFFNVYGPTEGTCICSAHEIKLADFQEDDRLVTLGRLAPNFEYLILDDQNRPAAIGELCLMGPQLALGYYRDQERTDQSFRLNPLNQAYSQTMYRTGDLVEEKNGRLYFRGRADNQIKHMGYRIELEEIEAGLAKLPCVKQGAAIHGFTAAGFSRIIAYIAVNETPDHQELRTALRAYLPDYMIPNGFEFLPELPKNQNGKVDRLSLKRHSGLS
ncbi:amino acid adenylation protein [Deltaproteobacteria bacterium]|nr:amino acid adenylation protein [Deltaproteobacteria bacterium]